MFRFLFLFILTYSSCKYGLSQSLQILDPGPYTVGFSSTLMFDYSRPAMIGQVDTADLNARALQIKHMVSNRSARRT